MNLQLFSRAIGQVTILEKCAYGNLRQYQPTSWSMSMLPSEGGANKGSPSTQPSGAKPWPSSKALRASISLSISGTERPTL